MKLTSKIKSTFSEETIRALAKLCDTMRIPSAIKKMELVQQIIKRNEPDLAFSILGGATNRVCLFINGMPYKFALDSQGYKDNLQEYALSPELQPYVPKAFETNGYILVCEPWRALTLEEFQLRKMEILKILDLMAQDYLLGDVGYLKKNYTNWGVDDSNNVGILDYAYMHRATEDLFTCEVCGQGILRYDSSYSVLKCSNATVCNAKYTYLDRKTIQGDQVDLDMIDEMKQASIVLRGTRDSIEVTNDDGLLVGGNKRIIKTKEQYLEYLKEERNMRNFDDVSALDLIIKKMGASEEEAAEIDKKLDELLKESEEAKYEEDDVEVIVEYDPLLDDEEEEEEYDDNEEYDDEESDIDYVVPISELISKISQPLSTQLSEVLPECIVGGKDNKTSLSSDNVEVATGDECWTEGVVIDPFIKRKEAMIEEPKKTYDDEVILKEGTLVDEKSGNKPDEEDNNPEKVPEESNDVVQEPIEEQHTDDGKEKNSEEEENITDPDNYNGVVVNGQPIRDLK